MTGGAAGRRGPDGPSWNPLACAGTALAPPVLLAAKLLVLYALASPAVWRREIFLPFLEPLAHLDGVAAPGLTRGLFLAAAGALLVNRAVRASAATCGLVILWGVVASRPAFSNSVTLLGCLLLLIGLGEAGRTPWLARLQVVLVYLGAGLNKLLDPDWTSGAFFEFWTTAILDHGVYRVLADALPPMRLSAAMGWATIAIELGLAVAFAWPRLQRQAIRAGIGFHVAMLVFSAGAVSWVFLYVMGASYLTFVAWPARLGVWCRGGRLRTALAALDVDGRLDVVAAPGAPAPGVYRRVVHEGRARTNGAALALVLARTPPTYAALAGAFAAVRLLT